MILFNQYKNVIILSLIGVLVLLLAIQSYRLNSYKADLANSNAQISILSSGIELQNKEILKLSNESIDRANKSLEELKKAKEKSKYLSSKIAKLKNNIGKFSSCDEAVNYSKSIL